MIKTIQSKKIIIFGDSFADPTHAHHIEPAYAPCTNVTTWYDSLGSDYDITNHALSGTGPHYSFKEYYNFIRSKEKKEDYIIIFLLSKASRIHFHNMGPEDMNHIRWDFDKKKSWWVEGDISTGTKQEAYYKFYRNEIDFFFLTMQDELKWSNFKNLGFLYMNSLLLNMKTIVFNAFGIKGLNKGLNIAKLNNPNFYLHPVELGKIAQEEFIDRVLDGGYDFTDNRRNHFSQENHTILYENIKKFINNDYNPLPFTKDIDYSYNLGRVRMQDAGKCIYE